MGLLLCRNKILSFTDEKSVGGQPFNRFPTNAAETALFWSQAWFAAVADMASPPVTIPPEASRAAFEATMAPLAAVPGGAIAALSAGAGAAAPLLAASIAPMILILPPPPPFTTVLTPIMAPFAALGVADPAAPATAIALAIKTWLMLGLWTPPGPVPVPTPLMVGP